MIFLEPPGSKFEEKDGGVFEKEVIRFGKYVDKYDNSKTMELNEKTADEVIKNQDKYGRIPVPPSHWEDNAIKNTGFVEKFFKTATGLSAKLNIISQEARQAIKDGRVWDVSVGIFHDYLDTRANKKVGARVHHVALTNEPYLKGMDGFKFNEQSDDKLYVFAENDKLSLTSKNDGDTSDSMKDKTNLEEEEGTQPDDTADEEQQEDETSEEEESEEEEEDSSEESDSTEASESRSELDEVKERLAEVERQRFDEKRTAAYDKLAYQGKLVPADKAYFESIAQNEESLAAVVKHYEAQKPKVSLKEQTGPQFNERSGTSNSRELKEAADFGNRTPDDQKKWEEFSLHPSNINKMHEEKV